MNFSARFLAESKAIIDALDPEALEAAAARLAAVRDRGGRLFILGVGGSAASASHAVNDFRKIAGFEAYAPTDNVSELTARTNDEGWDTVFSEWLRGSRLSAADGLLILSVGGGDLERGVSPNLVKALDQAKGIGASIIGVVGRDGGHTARVADAAVIIPVVAPERITPHTEAFHGVVWHLLVSHPALKAKSTMWESLSK
jgi:D-sedoheptulose 7-phosphate isomerase